MSTLTPSVAEISAKAIALLCREIGPVDTARFLGQFGAGFGNYTAERDALLGNPTVQELAAEVRARRRGTKPGPSAVGPRKGLPRRSRST